MADSTYIIEFSRAETSLIAVVAHTILQEFPDHDGAKSLIKTLVDQTNFVKSDPHEHGVGLIEEKQYSGIYKTNAQMARQLDLTYLAEGYYEF